MAHINLLPWREAAQSAKQKQFFMLLGAVALMALALTLLTGQFYQMRIDGQNQRNQYLKQEIQQLDVRIGHISQLNKKKTELEERITVVQQLQRSRNVGTQVLDELAKIVPGGIYLTGLSKQGNILEINGRSESNNHLANMMREIERSDLLADAQLNSIIKKDNQSRLLSDFNMKVRIKGLMNLDDKNQTGGAK
jgi:type IV pilus assembly protein PilN